jgi:hypothetical protein
VGVFFIGKMIHWMGQTYGAKQTLPQCIALAAYTATPLFLSGIMLLYPLLWLNLLLGLPVLGYTVYLLYTGVPIVMGIPQERGFLFSTAVLAVGLVTLVAVLVATVILWDIGIGPVYAELASRRGFGFDLGQEGAHCFLDIVHGHLNSNTPRFPAAQPCVKVIFLYSPDR